MSFLFFTYSVFQVSEHNNFTSYSDDDECIFRVQQFPNLTTTNINVDGLSIAVVIDSGATVNIVDRDTYYELRALKMSKLCPRTFDCLHTVQKFH